MTGSRDTLLMSEGQKHYGLLKRKTDIEGQIAALKKELKEVIAETEVVGRRLADLATGAGVQGTLPFDQELRQDEGPDAQTNAGGKAFEAVAKKMHASPAAGGLVDPGNSQLLEDFEVQDDDGKKIRLPVKIIGALKEEGVTSVAQAEVVIRNGTIASIKGVGSNPIKRLMTMIGLWRKHNPDPNPESKPLDLPETVDAAPSTSAEIPAADGKESDTGAGIPADVAAVLNATPAPTAKVGEVEKMEISINPKWKAEAYVLRALQADGRWAVGWYVKTASGVEGGEEISDDSLRVDSAELAYKAGCGCIVNACGGDQDVKTMKLVKFLREHAGLPDPEAKESESKA